MLLSSAPLAQLPRLQVALTQPPLTSVSPKTCPLDTQLEPPSPPLSIPLCLSVHSQEGWLQAPGSLPAATQAPAGPEPGTQGDPR